MLLSVFSVGWFSSDLGIANGECNSVLQTEQPYAVAVTFPSRRREDVLQLFSGFFIFSSASSWQNLLTSDVRLGGRDQVSDRNNSSAASSRSPHSRPHSFTFLYIAPLTHWALQRHHDPFLIGSRLFVDTKSIYLGQKDSCSCSIPDVRVLRRPHLFVDRDDAVAIEQSTRMAKKEP